MIKHIVIWNVKEPKKKNIEFLKKTFYSMKENIPAIIDVNVGITIDSPYSSRDIVLFTTHENYQKLEEYQEHPFHQDVKKTIAPLLQDKSSIDFEE